MRNVYKYSNKQEEAHSLSSREPNHPKHTNPNDQIKPSTPSATKSKVRSYPPIGPRTRRRLVDHILDAAHDPPRASLRVPNAQARRLPREALLGAVDELHAVRVVGADGFALVEGGDDELLVFGEVVPVVADVGELGVDEFLEDVFVEEGCFLGLGGFLLGRGSWVGGVRGEGDREGTYESPAVHFELRQILDVRRSEVVECGGRETPRFAVEARGELVEFADVGVLQDRPRVVQRDSIVRKHLAQHAVAGPVAVGVLIQQHGSRVVVVIDELHGRSGDDEARATVGEDNVRDLRLGADVIRFRGVEMRQPLH